MKLLKAIAQVNKNTNSKLVKNYSEFGSGPSDKSLL